MTTLGEALATSVFTDGDWVESKDQDPDGDVRLVQMADVGDGHYLDKSARFLTSDTAMRLKCTYLEPGDLLLSRMPDPLGRCCVFPGDDKACVTVVDVCIIRPDPGVLDARWLMHCINSPSLRRQIARFATGTTRARISRSNLAKIQIPLPSLSEQRRIAAILDHANALRAKRREALAHLDELTQSTFIDMFGDPLRNPQGWDRAPLAEVVGDVIDCPHSTPKWTEEGEICLRTSNLLKGEWDWTDTRYVSVDTFHERSKRGYLEPGDIVLSREGTVGIAAIVPSEPRLCMGQRLVQIKPATRLIPEYLLRVLLSELAPERIARVMIGSTSSHLNVKELRALMVPVPPMATQLSFARRMSSIDKIKAQHRTALAELDALFASLQSHAFRGEL